MQLLIVVVGHEMPSWIEEGFSRYAKRIPPELCVELREIKPGQRLSSRTAATVIQLEAARAGAALPRGCRMITLDGRGKNLTTVALVGSLTGWRQEGDDIVFVIGDAGGLGPALKAKARMLVRLSSLTLPHGMVHVPLAEQLYRAWNITQNHPYHHA